MNVVRFPKPKPHLECPKCHATTELRCDCGVQYVYVKAGVRAAQAVNANPEKSDVAIAKKIGTSAMTIARARKKSTSTNVDVGKTRIGRDGKTRKLPAKRKPRIIEDRTVEMLPNEEWEAKMVQVTQWCIGMDQLWTEQFGDWRRFEMTPCTKNLIEQCTETWNALLKSIKSNRVTKGGKKPDNNKTV